MPNMVKLKSLACVLAACSSCFAQENLSLREKELLNIVSTAYNLNMQAIDSLEIEYEMERMKPENPQTKIESLNFDNTKILVKKGTLGFEGNKLYNIENLNNNSGPIKFVQNGTRTRVRPSGVENYVAQTNTPGRLKPFTVTPWHVFDGGFTSDLTKHERFKVVSVKKVAREGEDCIKITGTRNANVGEIETAEVRIEIYYSQSLDYMPLYLESYVNDKPFGKATVKKYEKIKKNGNIVYVPVSIDGFINNANGELATTRKYDINKDSIRLNEEIPHEKFEINIGKNDILYDLDLQLTIINPRGDINPVDEMAFEDFKINNYAESIVEDNANDNISKIPKELNIALGNAIGIKLVYISPGTFVMGSPDTEIGYGGFLKKLFKCSRPKDEGPVQAIEIKDGFYMGIYELTSKQYRCFEPGYRQNLSYGKVMDADNQPALINWFEAKAFCDWLSNKIGRTVRLPSEAEWEYACRAGNSARFFWGDKAELAYKYANILDESAVKFWPDRGKRMMGNLFNCNDKFIVTAPVGSFMPNAFGLYDMIGNVSEWCEDLYGKYGQKSDASENNQDICRIVRGGGYGAAIYQARSAARSCVAPDIKHGHYGFRIVVEQE